MGDDIGSERVKGEGSAGHMLSTIVQKKRMRKRAMTEDEIYSHRFLSLASLFLEENDDK